MRTMLLPATIIALVLPGTALAQTLSNDMTCEEAVAHYERTGRIETNDNGEVLPIFGGVPVSERNELTCEDDEVPTPTLVRTRDREECAISYSCAGE